LPLFTPFAGKAGGFERFAAMIDPGDGKDADDILRSQRFNAGLAQPFPKRNRVGTFSRPGRWWRERGWDREGALPC